MFLKHLFLRPEILSRLIFESSEGGKQYVRATSNQRARRALPEEIIRQLFVLSLIHDYRYPEELINLEWPIQVGRERKRADIVVLNEDGLPSIIIEVKVENNQDSVGQLKSYMALTGTMYGAIVSPTEMICIRMDSLRSVHSVKDIPAFLGNPATKQVSITTAEYAGRDQAKLNVDEYHGLFSSGNSSSLDIRGLPWDSRIHSAFRTKNTDGTWRNMRGVNREILLKVETELRAAMMPPAHSSTETYVQHSVAAMPAPVTPILVEPSTNSTESIATLLEGQLNLTDTPPSADFTGNNHLAPETKSNLESDPLPKTISQQAVVDKTPFQEISAQPLVEIEKFEWDGLKHVKLAIGGHTLRLLYAEMDSYKKVRKQFFAEGIILDPRIKDFQWNDLLRQQLKANPRPVPSCLPNLTFGQIEQEVIDAVNQGRPGFCGGWISSIALDELLREKKLDHSVPRQKRQELLERLGYVHHPHLYRGRTTVTLLGGQRPILYIKPDHPNGEIKHGTAITRAYEAAQCAH